MEVSDEFLPIYISTEAGRFSLSGNIYGYSYNKKLTVGNLSWYRLFLDFKAEEFLIVDELDDLSHYHLLDVLIFCRNSLKNGGSLRIILPARPVSNEDRDEYFYCQTLMSVGFSVRLVAGRHRDGVYRDMGAQEAKAKDVKEDTGAMLVGGPRLEIVATKISEKHVGNNGSDNKVYAIGDSHVWFLSGRDRAHGYKNVPLSIRFFENIATVFSGFHLGPGLAYNLGKVGTKSQTTEKIQFLLEKLVPRGSTIMLSYGEIDCRAHVCRQAEQTSRSVEEIVDDLCRNYAAYLDTLVQQGWKPAVWGPVAPTWRTRWQHELYPVYGSFEDRKRATLRLTENMRSACAQRGLLFFSVIDKLFNEEGMTDKKYYSDNIHLSQYARPLLYSAIENSPLLASR